MRKRKKLPSRKRRTARYLLALAAVVLSASLTGFYTFTPGRAARENADQQGIGDAHVVKRVWAPEMASEWGRMLYLVEGERAMLLCPVSFNLLAGGFHGGIWSVVETWDGGDLYGGVLQHQETGVSYVFGRVDDPAVTAVDIRVTGMDGDVWERVLAPAWREKDGVRYFVEYVEELPLEESSGMKYQITAVGGDGGSAEIDPACWF